MVFSFVDSRVTVTEDVREFRRNLCYSSDYPDYEDLKLDEVMLFTNVPAVLIQNPQHQDNLQDPDVQFKDSKKLCRLQSAPCGQLQAAHQQPLQSWPSANRALR